MCLPITPFKIEKEWKSHGLSCAVVQNREAGNRCGYVRVPPGHPLYGKDCEVPEVEVHGGLTFAEIEPCDEHEDGQGWWFGFDCGHAFDAMYDPEARVEDMKTDDGRKLLRIHRDIERGYAREEHFWTLPEVTNETERLAEQLAV